MITPSLMELVSFVVLKEKAEDIASRILKLGVFHPVDIRHVEERISGLTPSLIEKQNSDLELLQQRLREISRKLNLELIFEYPQQPQQFSYKQVEQFLNDLDGQITPVLLKRQEMQEEINTDQSILSHVKDYMPLGLRRNSMYSFLEVSTGRIEEKNIIVLEKSLKDIPHVLYPFRQEASNVYAIIIGLRRDRIFLDKVLLDVGWEEIDFPKEAEDLSHDAQVKLQEKIEANKANLEGIKKEIKGIAQNNHLELNKISTQLHLDKSLLEAKRYACSTDKTVLFSGWVPLEEKDKFIKEIKSISGISYIESHRPEQTEIPKDEIPVRFKHGSLIRPFEMLIESYGIPRYGSIDPTVFVAISFLIMFGAMFGDIGHGLALIIISLALGMKVKSEKVKQPKTLLLYCGISSVIFGFLYGSFFGYEFESLWIKPIENIMDIFRISIFFGVGMITLGIVINVINALKDKDYTKAFFDKSGLIGGIIYWAAIGIITKIFVSKAPIPMEYSFLVLSGLTVIFLYPLVECIIKKKYSHFFESFMESLINLLEIFMGYLANTVSFIRVAAFALAHTGLFIAIFNFAKIIHVDGPMGDVLSWLILIFGNIGVIGLEGLVVGIQSVRLNYYEFFSKFFVAGKQLYKPLTI